MQCEHSRNSKSPPTVNGIGLFSLVWLLFTIMSFSSQTTFGFPSEPTSLFRTLHFVIFTVECISWRETDGRISLRNSAYYLLGISSDKHWTAISNKRKGLWVIATNFLILVARIAHTEMRVKWKIVRDISFTRNVGNICEERKIIPKT